MLGSRPAGSLQKIHHAGRDQGKFLAGAAGSGLVAAAHLGVFLQVGFTVAAHEGKIQRPPGQAHDRHPDQLLLEKKLEQGNAPVQQVLQHQDVNPGLVVGIDQVPAARVQALKPLHIPDGGLGQAHPAAVAGNPGLCNAQQHRIDPQPHGPSRHQQLEQCKQQQNRYPDQGVDRQQAGGSEAAQRCRQTRSHGRLSLAQPVGLSNIPAWRCRRQVFEHTGPQVGKLHRLGQKPLSTRTK